MLIRRLPSDDAPSGFPSNPRPYLRAPRGPIPIPRSQNSLTPSPSPLTPSYDGREQTNNVPYYPLPVPRLSQETDPPPLVLGDGGRPSFIPSPGTHLQRISTSHTPTQTSDLQAEGDWTVD